MSFINDDIQAVWNKASIDLNNDPNLWRRDQCGAWIGHSFYGNRDSQYGWEIDHINPNGVAILFQILDHYNGKIMPIKAMGD